MGRQLRSDKINKRNYVFWFIKDKRLIGAWYPGMTTFLIADKERLYMQRLYFERYFKHMEGFVENGSIKRTDKNKYR